LKKFLPVALVLMLAVALAVPMAASAASQQPSVPHYNPCSSGRHVETWKEFTLPGDGSYKFSLSVQAWLDSGGNYCGVKQPIMHSWQTEGMPFAADENMSYQSIGIWRGGTNLGTWVWTCPGYSGCILKDTYWYGLDIHNIACTDGLYPYGEVDEAGGVSEWRYGQIYTSDYEGTAGSGLTMNFC